MAGAKTAPQVERALCALAAAAALRSGGGTELICDPVMRRNILSRLKRKRRREPLGSRCTTLLRPSAKE